MNNKRDQELKSTIEVPWDTTEYPASNTALELVENPVENSAPNPTENSVESPVKNKKIISPNAKPINHTEAFQIRLTEIHLPASQPRRYFDPQALDELTESIKQHGVLQPLLVRPLKSEDYELVAGERRYLGAQRAGLTEVPVVVRELSDEQAWQLALIENLQREDLNPIEETEGILQLLSLRLQIASKDVPAILSRLQNEDNGKVTRNVAGNSEREIVEQVFVSLGFKRDSFLRHRLPLLKLPEELLEALRQGRIEYTKARAIAQIKDPEARVELLEIAIAEGLSLKEIKQRVAEIKKATEAELDPEAEDEDEDTDEAGEKPDKADKPESLKSIINKAYNELKKSKVWKKKEHEPQLKKILEDIEALLNEE